MSHSFQRADADSVLEREELNVDVEDYDRKSGCRGMGGEEGDFVVKKSPLFTVVLESSVLLLQSRGRSEVWA